jgi:hypothetical protein
LYDITEMTKDFKHGTRCEVIADSIAPNGARLTTIEVTFHRFILAEVNTHRKLSRNSASSRAIPFEKMLARAMRYPALPIKWPCEQPGMSGGAELTGDDLLDAQMCLNDIQDATTSILSNYFESHPDKSRRLHKSLLNRPLEWFMYHTAVLSSTEWENLLEQRDTETAQPEFARLAHLIRVALQDSTPVEMVWGGLHLPYVGINNDDVGLSSFEKLKISTARCGRVSYLTHDGIRDIAEDLRMFESTLWKNGHWSPMEHPAIATTTVDSRNFDEGWAQLRSFADTDQMGLLEGLLAFDRSNADVVRHIEMDAF